MDRAQIYEKIMDLQEAYNAFWDDNPREAVDIADKNRQAEEFANQFLEIAQDISEADSDASLNLSDDLLQLHRILSIKLVEDKPNVIGFPKSTRTATIGLDDGPLREAQDRLFSIIKYALQLRTHKLNSQLLDYKKMLSGILPESNVKLIRENPTDSERKFCQKIDELVQRFNSIAGQEIIKEAKPASHLSVLDDGRPTTVEASKNFQRNLNQTTMPQKIEDLKEVFGALRGLAMNAIRDLGIHGDEFLGSAVDRVSHVLDVMNDDDSEHAPALVRSSEIDHDQKWKPLLQERNSISEDLRRHLPNLYERLSKQSPT